MRIGEDRTPTSPEDLPFHIFTEQLQKIADQLSMAIEGLIAAAAAKFSIHLYVTRQTGVIHGDQYEILDQFSKVSFFFARRNAFSVTRMQAWDRFLYVYRDLIKNLTRLSLQIDPEEAQAVANAQSKRGTAAPKSNNAGLVM